MFPLDPFPALRENGSRAFVSPTAKAIFRAASEGPR